MSKDPQHSKRIDAYLAGELTQEGISEFEQELKDDVLLREELKERKKIVEGIEGFEFKKMLMGFHNKYFGDGRGSQ